MEKEKQANFDFYNKLYNTTINILVDNKIKPKEGGDAGFELEVEMSDAQKFNINLFKRYSKIQNTIGQLETIIKLIEVKPSIYFTQEAGIKYSEYLGYNLENYFIRITTIIDQSIILISEYYNLGLPPQSTSLKILLENIHTKDKEVVKLIKSFDSSMQPIKKIRNLIAHRGEYNDEDILKIEANLYMLSLIEDKNLNEPVFDEMFKYIDDLINKKIEFAKRNTVSVKKFLFALDHVLNIEEEKLMRIK